MKLVPWSRKSSSAAVPAQTGGSKESDSAAAGAKARQRYDLPEVGNTATVIWMLEGPDPDAVVYHDVPAEVRGPEPGPGAQIGVKLELTSEDAQILPHPGDPVTMRWRNGPREVQIAARVINYTAKSSGGLGWKVEVLSEPALTQRRRYVREMIAVPLTIYDADDNPLAAGNTIDISEGGIACNVNGIMIQEGSDIKAEVTLPEVGTLTIDGIVLRSAEGRGATIIKFEDGHAHQDTLRQLVFARQIANRQAMMEWES